MRRRVVGARFVDLGYTPAARWVVTFDDGSSAFAKSGVDSETSRPATWRRHEHRALPALIEAGDRAVLSGDALVHFDVRSDNLCILDGRVKVIDWPGYARGSPLVDRVGWLPSLWREGGPAPW